MCILLPSNSTAGNSSSRKTCLFPWRDSCRDIHWSAICKLVRKKKQNKNRTTQKQLPRPILPGEGQNKSWFMYSWGAIINNETSPDSAVGSFPRHNEVSHKAKALPSRHSKQNTDISKIKLFLFTFICKFIERGLGRRRSNFFKNSCFLWGRDGRGRDGMSSSN